MIDGRGCFSASFFMQIDFVSFYDMKYFLQKISKVIKFHSVGLIESNE